MTKKNKPKITVIINGKRVKSLGKYIIAKLDKTPKS